jgi:hypothetical protein
MSATAFGGDGWRCGTSSGLLFRKASDILDRLSGDR